MAQAAQRGSAPVNGVAGSSSANAGGAAATSSSTSNKDIPRDARIIGLILASLGVTDAEPGVVAMLLEFAHRYTLEILQDAQVYADHAQRPRDPSAASTSPLEVDDLRMAVSSKLEHSYSSPLPKEFLLPLAAQINRVPLPILPESYGIRLPHERDRLTAVNWNLAPVTEKRSYPELEQLNQAQSGTSGQAAPTASTSQGPAVNGTGASGSAMDLDLAQNDLFGGQGDDEDEDDDDEDDEDMEEVVDTSLQADGAPSKEVDADADDAEADEDAEEDDAEEDEDNGDEDDDDDDGDGDEDGHDEP